MRRSSRGNPWHDERGRFTNGPGAVKTVNNSDEYYRQRTEERFAEKQSADTDCERSSFGDVFYQYNSDLNKANAGKPKFTREDIDEAREAFLNSTEDDDKFASFVNSRSYDSVLYAEEDDSYSFDNDEQNVSMEVFSNGTIDSEERVMLIYHGHGHVEEVKKSAWKSEQKDAEQATDERDEWEIRHNMTDEELARIGQTRSSWEKMLQEEEGIMNRYADIARRKGESWYD